MRKARAKLMLQNVIDSVRILKTKVKKGFDGDKLEADIRGLFNTVNSFIWLICRGYAF